MRPERAVVLSNARAGRPLRADDRCVPPPAARWPADPANAARHAAPVEM
jgi:hypothetical protein